MPFVKGQSGNPSGRPKVVAEVRDLARVHTTLAVRTLVEIASDKDQDARARVAACNSLLDRGFGKPAQSLSIDTQPTHIRRVILCREQPSIAQRPGNGRVLSTGNVQRAG